MTRIGAVTFLFTVFAAGQDSPPTERANAAAQSPNAKGSAGPDYASGESKLSRAAARRNDNIQVNPVDNDAVKEANVRIGNNVTSFWLTPVETSVYAAEYGRVPPGSVAAALEPASVSHGTHADLYESSQNNALNARTFFQAGSLEPSRQNTYGARLTTLLGFAGAVTASFSQHEERGMVNGNIQVPLPSERSPLVADPSARAFIGRILGAFPAALPNRVDLDPRLLNTNTPQKTYQTDAGLRTVRDWGDRNHLVAAYNLNRLRIDAFQLVAGQNPDTEIHSHRARLGFTRSLSINTQAAIGLAFTRSLSDMRSDPTAVGPSVFTGHVLQDLGPDIPFPIHRAANTFRAGAVFSRNPANSRHRLSWGGELARNQVNGFESVNSRGEYDFRNTTQHTAVENLRLGQSAWYEVTLGSLNRGFRNIDAALFAADQWSVSSVLQLYYGIRYSLATAPIEVNGLNTAPYGCDCNNFSPRFSIAYRMRPALLLRASYTVSFGEIYPATYSQMRLNAPGAIRIQLQNPDLLHPIGGLDLTDPSLRQSPTRLSPDLVSPYSHQYNLGLERDFGVQSASRYLLRLQYVGSRTFKLLDGYWLNRAIPVTGLPLTNATVDQRRPDPRYYDVRAIVNGGAAYLDAAQASLVMPCRRGLALALTYTFGKALDTGANYASTGAKTDISKYRAQTQFDSQKDRKALSDFDSKHALMLSYSYDLPRAAVSALLGTLVNGWQVAGATLLKTGTPFTVMVGADGPGYGNVDGLVSERPNLLDPTILGKTIGNPDRATEILRLDRFSCLAPGQMAGTLGRNSFRKGGIANFNLAVSRRHAFGKHAEHAATLRAEAYNLTNHPQFDAPLYLLTNPSFGKITNTLNNGRVLEIGVNLVY